MLKRVLLLSVTLWSTTAALVLGATIRPVAGPVILARSGPNAIYLWDASPYVAKLVAEKNLGADALRGLEATAMTALGEEAKSSHAKTIALRVVYTRSGAVSPAYGTLTFNGIEKLVTITCARNAAVKNAASWAQSLAGGKIPGGAKVDISGKLPPVQ